MQRSRGQRFARKQLRGGQHDPLHLGRGALDVINMGYGADTRGRVELVSGKERSGKVYVASDKEQRQRARQGAYQKNLPGLQARLPSDLSLPDHSPPPPGGTKEVGGLYQRRWHFPI